MMKNSIKKLLVGALFVGVGLSATTLEEFNQYIADAKHPDLKQMVRCEREGAHLKKSPEECLKAVDMLLESKKNLKAGYRFDIYGRTSDYTQAFYPKIYAQTDKEFVDRYIGNYYYNAGFIYEALGQHKAKMKMYKKALEYGPNDDNINLELGAAYFYGEGVGINKIKAYEHWRIAANQGNKGAQNNLNYLCSQSPWACK